MELWTWFAVAGGVVWTLALLTFVAVRSVDLVERYLELRSQQFRFEREMQAKLDVEEDGFSQAGPRVFGPDDSDWGKVP